MGFEYESCLKVVLWERRSSTLQGFELDSSNMGSWTLDKHHVLDLQNGELFFVSWRSQSFFSQTRSLVEVAFALLRGRLRGLTINIQPIVKYDPCPHLHKIQPRLMARSNGRLNEVHWRSEQKQKFGSRYGPG